VWDRPLTTLSGAHLVSRILDLCGGRNVFADAPTLAPVVSVEAVIAARPEVVLAAAPAAQAERWLWAWRPGTPLAAAGALRLERVDPSLANRMGPRVLEGVREVCAAVDRAR
jgi:iron complex transport system substrate-binding protein